MGKSARLFANTLQVRELLRVVADADLTPPQRARVRAAVYAMFVRRQRMTLRTKARAAVLRALTLGHLREDRRIETLQST